MKLFNKKTGGIGESLALEYLLKKGFELVLRNYSTRFGEIDLIMRDKDVLVFVEVKAKKSEDWGHRRKCLLKANTVKSKIWAWFIYMEKDVLCRIDMVAVDLFVDLPVIRHYPNVIL